MHDAIATALFRVSAIDHNVFNKTIIMCVGRLKKLKYCSDVQGAAKKHPRQKLQFLRARWIFYFQILYDYSQELTAFFFIVLYAHLIFLKSNYVNLCRNGRIWKTKYDFCQPLKIILYLWPYLVRFQKSEILVENDNFSYPVPFNLHDHLWSIYHPANFSKNLIQTVRVPGLLDDGKILPKSSTFWVACNNVTDRGQTTDERLVP